MDYSRRRVNGDSNGNLYFERLNGFVMLEGQDQDYELTANFNEIILKPLKNQDNRLAFKDLILTAYGRNIGTNQEANIRDVLKALRPQVPSKKDLRTRESVTQSEKDMLQEKYKEVQLPGTWHFNGRYYMNDDCETMDEHPNME